MWPNTFSLLKSIVRLTQLNKSQQRGVAGMLLKISWLVTLTLPNNMQQVTQSVNKRKAKHCTSRCMSKCTIGAHRCVHCAHTYIQPKAQACMIMIRCHGNEMTSSMMSSDLSQEYPEMYVFGKHNNVQQNSSVLAPLRILRV